MIGECSSLAPRKNSLNLFNLIMSLLAGIFMIVSCASYSANTKTIQNLSFMVLKGTTTNSKLATWPKSVECSYVSLQGFCTAICGDGQRTDSTTGKIVDVPTDDPQRDCATGNDLGTKNGKPVYGPSVTLYKTAIEQLKCSTTTNATTKTKCTKYEQCQNGGNVTVAFAAIGCVAALFSMVAFAWRMNSDGVCPKLISVGLAIGTFVACTVAFAAFQPCATTFYNDALASTKIFVSQGFSYQFSVRPGVGGAFAVTSFVFFIYVMFMSVFIPSAGPAGSNAGLDNKAPQV